MLPRINFSFTVLRRLWWCSRGDCIVPWQRLCTSCKELHAKRRLEDLIVHVDWLPKWARWTSCCPTMAALLTDVAELGHRVGSHSFGVGTSNHTFWMWPETPALRHCSKVRCVVVRGRAIDLYEAPFSTSLRLVVGLQSWAAPCPPFVLVADAQCRYDALAGLQDVYTRCFATSHCRCGCIGLRTGARVGPACSRISVELQNQ